jgi:hypothetical protein
MSLARKESAKVQKKRVVKDKKTFFFRKACGLEKGCVLGVME